MGSYFQVFVDEEVSSDNAASHAQEILTWLIERGIVQPTPIRCVLDPEEVGYPPGPNYREAVQDHGGEDYLLMTKANGLEVHVGRDVYHPFQGDVGMFCPNCGLQAEFDEAWDAAILEWYNREGAGMLGCRNCPQVTAIDEWIYDPPWGFGELGFTFWNWPMMRERFVEELRAQFKHKTVFVVGKL